MTSYVPNLPSADTRTVAGPKEISATWGNTPDLNVYWLSLPSLRGLCNMA